MDHRSELLPCYLDYTPPHEVIARDGKAELVRVWDPDLESDASYWLMTGEWRADLGPIGLVQRVSSGTRKNERVFAERPNAFGNFVTEPGVSLEKLLEKVYDLVSSLTFGRTDDAALFTGWETQRVLARFRDFRHLYSPNDIVPEFNDTMVITKISQDCDRTCLYCPDRRDGKKRLELFTREKVRMNMELARAVEVEYHGGHLDLMIEHFLNGSDLLWFPAGEPRAYPSPLEIVEMGASIFPEAWKRYAFMGLPNVNRTPPGYLRRIREAGLYSVLVGVESFHEQTSRFLGKPESTASKVEAIEKLKEAGFKVKLIIQVGMVGEGFMADGRFYSGREGLEETARVCARILGDPLTRHREGDRTKALISEYLSLEGTPLFPLHQEGKIVTPYRSAEGLRNDVEFFLRLLGGAANDPNAVETGYEAAIQSPSRSV